MTADSDLHRRFGAQLNNHIWSRLDVGDIGPEMPLDDREQILYAAYASAYHWSEVGTVANRARAEHLISRTALKLGLSELGLHHAQRCLELVESAPEETEDWDLAFAYEALARSLAATGQTGEAQNYRDLAVDQTATVAGDGDRAVLETELTREPWFGLS